MVMQPHFRPALNIKSLKTLQQLREYTRNRLGVNIFEPSDRELEMAKNIDEKERIRPNSSPSLS